MSDTIKTILGAAGVVFGAIVLFVIGVAAFKGPPVATEKDKWARAAAECWKGYERKSLTPSEKAGVAKFCEDMEAKAK